MLYISIAFTFFALLGGMHLLAKTKKEMLGKFFNWISYIIIALSLLLLICQISQGICRMTCREGSCSDSECYMPGMIHGGWHHGYMRSEKCCDEMDECKDKMDSAHCQMKHKCMEEEEVTKADSVKK